MSAEILLTVEEAATRLKISKHTLNRWRVTGEGPPFVKYGPRLVRYAERVLDEWAGKRTHGSTSGKVDEELLGRGCKIRTARSDRSDRFDGLEARGRRGTLLGRYQPVGHKTDATQGQQKQNRAKAKA